MDEIHRLSPVVEEYLYPALEDFTLDILLDRGPSARSLKINLERFTLVGATTRSGLLSAPLRARFGVTMRLDYYGSEDLTRIVTRSASILKVTIEEPAAAEIARRSRGTPRIANRLLRRVRDFALIKADGIVTLHVTREALRLLEVDERGLDEMDRRLLDALIRKYQGGPVGTGHAGGGGGRGGRDARGRVRAVPDPGRVPEAHVARPRSHAARLPASRARRARSARRRRHDAGRGSCGAGRTARIAALLIPPAGQGRPAPHDLAPLPPPDPATRPMRLEDLDYELPSELIAQHPAERRDASRLLVIERSSGAMHDLNFADLPRWLRAGDALAINETRVRPARLHVRRASGGAVELLFVRPASDGAWLTLARPAKKAPPGGTLETPDGALALEVTEAREGGERLCRVTRGDLAAVLAAQGEIPLPPYIHRAPEAADAERYQTVYAREDGAVASPTAGLHFTRALLENLEAAGIAPARLLLHVGPGTFRPVTEPDPARHVMDEEWFEVSAEAAATLRTARERGGRIVAVGTTSVRALESACDAHRGTLEPASGWTRKFIAPPYRFQAVDVLLTNFHLPRTTLLLLVSAFAGEDLLRRAYQHAVRERYRFYSYGDAMLVV